VQIPRDQDIRALHERYAPSAAAFGVVYAHCVIVCGIAEQLLAGADLGLDAELVRAGCLLHDIGVYRLYDPPGRRLVAPYLRHGLLGHELLAEAGFPEVICRFASCHTGMGLSRADVLRQGLPLPAGDYLAESGEEQLVMYADKFHSKTDPPVFVSAEEYAASVRRFGEDKVATFAAMRRRFGEPDLAPFMSRSGPG
jgi:uncharacterized protein